MLDGVLSNREDMRRMQRAVERSKEEREARIIEQTRRLEAARLEKEEHERKKVEEEIAKEQKRIEKENQKKDREEKKREREEKKREREREREEKAKVKEEKKVEKEATKLRNEKERERKVKVVSANNHARGRTKRLVTAKKASQTPTEAKARRDRKKVDIVHSPEPGSVDERVQDDEVEEDDTTDEEGIENEVAEVAKDAEPDVPAASSSKKPKGKRTAAQSEPKKMSTRKSTAEKNTKAVEPSATVATDITATPSNELDSSVLKPPRSVKSLPRRKKDPRSGDTGDNLIPPTSNSIRSSGASSGIEPGANSGSDVEGEKENMSDPPRPQSPLKIRIRISKPQFIPAPAKSMAVITKDSDKAAILEQSHCSPDANSSTGGKGKGKASVTAVHTIKRKRASGDDPIIHTAVEHIDTESHPHAEAEDAVETATVMKHGEPETLGRGKRTRWITPKAAGSADTTQGRPKRIAVRN